METASATQPQRGLAMNSLNAHPHATRFLIATLALIALLAAV